ncbi:hypothetical protein [Cupriavidus necator]
MTSDEILSRIEEEAKIVLRPSDALPALLEVLVEIAPAISPQDLTTLTIISGILYRAVEAEHDAYSVIAAAMRRSEA